MSQIIILAIGKLKDPNFKKLEEHYLDRLSHYTTLSIICLKDSSSKLREKKIEEESSEIEKQIKPGDAVIVLDEKGKLLTSRALSQTIQKNYNQSFKRQVYIIGGAFGLSDTIKKKASLLLSLSTLTLPHELARVTLLEQLYRAHTILRGEKYHHD